MFKRSMLSVAVLGCSLLAAPSVAKELRYSSWVPPKAVENDKGVVPFLKEIEKRTDGELTGTLFEGGQLFSATSTVSGISSGAVDAGFVIAVFSPSELPYTALLTEMQAVATDPVAAVGAANETLLISCKKCQEEHARKNLRTLGGNATSNYYLMCRTPVGSIEDLKGKKLRGTTGFYGRWAKALGAVSVNVSASEAAQALDRGVLDCTISPLNWLVAFGLQDYVKSVALTQPHGAWHSIGTMTVNADFWERLSDDQKKAMIQAMPGLAARVTLGNIALAEPSLASAKNRGVKTVDLGEAYKKRWEEFVSAETDVIIETARQRGLENPEEVVMAFLENYAKWRKISAEIGHDQAKLEQALWKNVYSKLAY